MASEAEKYRWVAIRCCCEPTKVLGFMRLRESIVQSGQPLVVTTISEALKVEQWPVELRPMEEVHCDQWEQEMAIYSEDRPVEFWRRIRGFVEVHA